MDTARARLKGNLHALNRGLVVHIYNDMPRKSAEVRMILPECFFDKGGVEVGEEVSPMPSPSGQHLDTDECQQLSSYTQTGSNLYPAETRLKLWQEAEKEALNTRRKDKSTEASFSLYQPLPQVPSSLLDTTNARQFVIKATELNLELEEHRRWLEQNCHFLQ